MARGLKSNHTRLIGYGWHKTEDPGRPNALLDRFLYDTAQAAEAWGYHILTFAQPSEISVRRYAELIQTTRIDGLVLTDISYHDERVRYLRDAGVPFVAFGHTDEEGDFPSVEVDGRLGMKLAVEHLISRGHERIALLCWPAGMRVGDVRVVHSLDQQFGLDKEAIRTLRQWRFKPGMRLGQPVQGARTHGGEHDPAEVARVARGDQVRSGEDAERGEHEHAERVAAPPDGEVLQGWRLSRDPEARHAGDRAQQAREHRRAGEASEVCEISHS